MRDNKLTHSSYKEVDVFLGILSEEFTFTVIIRKYIITPKRNFCHSTQTFLQQHKSYDPLMQFKQIC